jgi:AcrR family transcriptional regulator
VTTKQSRPRPSGPRPATTRPDGRATRWEGQQERRRNEFVDAALRAIAEYGPDVSTGQIAAAAGVARTRIYKHFEDAADLQAAIAERAFEQITTDLEPLWKPQGSAMSMIGAIIDTIIGYLSANRNLYHYLTKYAPSARNSQRDVVTDVKAAIGAHLTGLFRYFLAEFGADARTAEIDAFALVGMGESAISQWLDNPGGLTRDELCRHLTGLIWVLLDQVLREAGITLDPDAPLVIPGTSAETAAG